MRDMPESVHVETHFQHEGRSFYVEADVGLPTEGSWHEPPSGWQVDDFEVWLCNDIDEPVEQFEERHESRAFFDALDEAVIAAAKSEAEGIYDRLRWGDG